MPGQAIVPSPSARVALAASGAGALSTCHSLAPERSKGVLVWSIRHEVTHLPPTFLSIGSINADFQFEVSADLGAGGTLPAKSFVQRAGGKGANRALLANRVGLNSLLIGRVGTDHFAEQALDPLRQAGVDLSGVSQSIEAATGVSMIAVPDDGAKTILLAANANQAWDDASLALLKSIIADAAGDTVITLDFEISPEAVQATLDAASQRRLPVVADGSFGEAVRPDHLPKLHAIAPNVQEAEAITGMDISSDDDAENAARWIMEQGVSVVCIKLSDGGCMLATDGKVEKIAAIEVEVSDKTGAGDAFTAALGVAIAEGESARDAAIHGVAASTLAVTHKGSQEAYPTRAQLDQMADRVAQHGASSL